MRKTNSGLERIAAKLCSPVPKSYPLGKTKNLKTIGSISKEAVLSEESFIVGVDPTVSRPTKEMLAANPSWWKAKSQPFAAKGREERKQ